MWDCSMGRILIVGLVHRVWCPASARPTHLMWPWSNSVHQPNSGQMTWLSVPDSAPGSLHHWYRPFLLCVKGTEGAPIWRDLHPVRLSGEEGGSFQKKWKWLLSILSCGIAAYTTKAKSCFHPGSIMVETDQRHKKILVRALPNTRVHLFPSVPRR